MSQLESTQFESVVKVLDEAKKQVDTEVRKRLREKDYYKAFESLHLAARTIKDRFLPYKQYLNVSISRIIDELEGDLSIDKLKKKKLEDGFKHVSTLVRKIDHVILVVKEYHLSAQKSHLFDDSGLVEIDDRLVFIAMPFEPRQTMNELHGAIKTAVLDYDSGLKPSRADDITGDRIIYEEITRSIRRCNLFIAAVHGANPNVYFELGYARALHKKVFTIAETNDDLKFDIKSVNCIVEPNCDRVKHKLGNWLRQSF